MKTTPRFLTAVSLSFFVSAPLAHAHPGHDGHELTWDFSHLVAHPVATLGCAAILAVTAWGGWQFLRRSSFFRR